MSLELVLALLALGGSPALAQPAGDRGPSAARQADRGQSRSKARARIPGRAGGQAPRSSPAVLPTWPDAPDPPPLVTREFLDLQLQLARENVKVLRVRRVAGNRPTAMRRFGGRFAVQLFAYGLLLDVVRFNFPLTAASGEHTPLNERLGQALAAGITARTTVRIPFDHRVNRIVVRDLRTNRSFAVSLREVQGPAPRLSPPDDLRTSSFGKKNPAARAPLRPGP